MKRKHLFIPFLSLVMTGAFCPSYGQEREEFIPFGTFDRWVVREIKESGVIGGKVRYVYEIAEGDTIKGNIPYRGDAKSPWGTSNVMARVSGVTKTSVTVFPEKRGDGFCARLDTRLEEVKVLGMINISVLASGSVFLGAMDEPIKDTKNPNSKLLIGMPFAKRPQALVMDYKLKVSGEDKRQYIPGFGSKKEVPGRDYASVTVILQQRREDADGRIYAKRVGTAIERLGNSTDGWINGHKIPIKYGNITSDPAFKPYMDIIPEDKSYYSKNSKGEIVPVVETGWAASDELPTHIIVMMSSSYDSAYIGSLGNSFWIDNVKFAY